MKKLQINFLRYCLALVLVSALTTITGACSAKSASSTSEPMPTLSSITLTTTAQANLAVGSSQQFTATGTYSDGHTEVITSQVTWISSNPMVVNVSSAGLATGVITGTANITASMSGIVSSMVTLTVVRTSGVTPTPKLSSMIVTPTNPPNLTVGSSQQFTVFGTYADGHTEVITSQVTWISSNPMVVDISSTGLATGVIAGTANITASVSGIASSMVTLTVARTMGVTPTPKLSSMIITPTNPLNLTVGSSQQFTAIGTYADGTTSDITSQARITWISSAAGVASISSIGSAYGLAPGTSRIMASMSGITSPPIILRVISPWAILSSISVIPTLATDIAVGSSLQFTATGTYSDDHTEDITSQVSWTSDNITVATISSIGLALGISFGSTNISAYLSGVTSPAATMSVIATTPQLNSIAVKPTTAANLAAGSYLQFTATGIYPDGHIGDITSQVTWTSDPTTVALISSDGLAYGLAPGMAYITASFSGVISPPVMLVVKPP